MTQVSPSPSNLTFSQVASPDHHSSIIHIDRPFFFRPHILCSQPYYQADLIGTGPLKLDSKSNYFLNMSNYWRLSYFLLPIAIQQLAKHDFSKLFFRELLELLLPRKTICTSANKNPWRAVSKRTSRKVSRSCMPRAAAFLFRRAKRHGVIGTSAPRNMARFFLGQHGLKIEA